MSRRGRATAPGRVRRGAVLVVGVAVLVVVGCTEEGQVAAEGPSSWWMVVLLGITLVGALTAALSHHHGRRLERDALRDQALLDVDWLIDVSAEHPSPDDRGPRTAAIRSRTDRLHRTLGMLASGSDRETATAALQLRGSVLALADLTVERLTEPVGAGRALDTRLGEERQRVRIARLRLVEATR